MIYTLTLNPSIDYHVWLTELNEGSINQVQREWKDAGGKGINVSKVLSILGSESTALGFVGGFTGKFIVEQIEKEGIAHRFIPIEGESRINIKIKSGIETDLSGVSPHVSYEALSILLDQCKQLTKNDFLVLAGSIPASLPSDLYKQLMHEFKTQGVQIFLDAKGQALNHCLPEGPFLIKPNHHELGELFGVEIDTPMLALSYGHKAVQLGAKHVIVSMAGKGAVFVSEKEAYIAEIPQRKPVNSIGAGDSMVAGFLHQYIRGAGLRSAFQYAVATGSATALSEGFCTVEQIEAFLPHVMIKNIDLKEVPSCEL